MGDGRKALAPCGHFGEHVVGQYVQCLECDAIPEEIDPEETPKLLFRDLFDDEECPKCRSLDIEEFVFHGSKMHCLGCGAVW